MPILGIEMPIELVTATRDALLDGIRDSAKLKMLFLGRSFILRRKPYTGDYQVWGWTQTTGYFQIAKFGMLPMPGCRAICILYHVEVEKEWQGQGIGKELLRIRLEAAKKVGYQRVLCTVVDNNSIEMHLLVVHDFVCDSWIRNPRTNHTVAQWSKNL